MLKLNKATEQRVADKVRAGAFRNEDEVVRCGLDLIEAQEAFRRAVAEGEAQLDRGEYVTAEQSQERIRAVIERHRPRA
jgi:Arc/MetJ-type ribon-helix-helix transcriptional regulator